ncbi:MAG: PfkB family carbohydrate kinase, partial [Acidimicrobiaceae bacterium]|nr:PfkB family carbohydrate kinase [Acidimicrobiaceae bacterium]
KTGLLRRREIVELVAERVESGALPAPVVDPVMVDGGGARLVPDEVEHAYRRRLFPLARAITPNRGEAELLARTSLPDAEAVLDCAQAFRGLGAEAVVVTGGGFDGDPDDAVITASGDAWIVRNSRIATDNVRGSGCTFSAAMTTNLALGADLRQAVGAAGRFVRSAIEASASWQVEGRGPVSHAMSRSTHPLGLLRGRANRRDNAAHTARGRGPSGP